METVRLKNGYRGVVLALLAGSFIAQWVHSWFVFAGEQLALGENLSLIAYAAYAATLTANAWQLIALQVLAQMLALAYLLALVHPEVAAHAASEETEEAEEGVEDEEMSVGTPVYQAA